MAGKPSFLVLSDSYGFTLFLPVFTRFLLVRLCFPVPSLYGTR